MRFMLAWVFMAGFQERPAGDAKVILSEPANRAETRLAKAWRRKGVSITRYVTNGIDTYRM
jgi:hypothetical protein